MTYPLHEVPGTVLLWQDWVGLSKLTPSEGSPLTSRGDASLLGGMNIEAQEGIFAITPITPWPQPTTYGTVIAPQQVMIDPRKGASIDLAWSEPTAWKRAPNFAGVFGLGRSQSNWQSFEMLCQFGSGVLQVTVNHRQGPNAALYTATAKSQALSCAPDTFHDINVSLSPSGVLSVAVDGVRGPSVQIPSWDTVTSTMGGRNGFYIGGKFPQDYRPGWKCAAVRVAAFVPEHPTVTVDFSRPAATKTQVGRLHIVNGAVGPTPELPLLRTDKILSGVPVVEGSTPAHYTRGIGGRFSYCWDGFDAYFESQIKAGVKAILLGIGSGPQMLGGTVPPIPAGAPWSPYGKSYSYAVPTDFDAFAEMIRDAWWHFAVEKGFPITGIDAWNEANLYSGNPPVGHFWRGTPEQYFDLVGRSFRAIAAAAETRPDVVKPRFTFFSEAGFDPSPGSARRSDVWYAAMVEYLKANPGTPCDEVGLHCFSGSLSNVAGWRAYVSSVFTAAGLPVPALSNTETLPIDANAGGNFLPWKEIGHLRDGAWAAAQTIQQLAYECRHGISAHVIASQYSIDGGDGIFEPGGGERAILHALTLYDALGDKIHLCDVRGCASLSALAGEYGSGSEMVLLSMARWTGGGKAASDVTVELGPRYAGREFNVYVVSPEFGSVTESSPGNDGLAIRSTVTADCAGNLLVAVPHWGVVGLVAKPVPAPPPAPAPSLQTIFIKMVSPDGTVTTIGPVLAPVEVTRVT